MSHQALFDALHAAKVRMMEERERELVADRDDEIGDELAEREMTDDEYGEVFGRDWYINWGEESA